VTEKAEGVPISLRHSSTPPLGASEIPSQCGDLSWCDTRVLMLPLLGLLCVLALMFDTDNVLWVLVKHGGLPFLVIALSSRRSPAASVRDLIPNAVGTERSYSEHGPVQHI
jgi:hypothetical protein